MIVIGLNELKAELQELADRIPVMDLVAADLAQGMEKYAHRLTGYLAESVYYDENIAGASAPYAGYEIARGGDHDFEQKAVDNVDLNAYADFLMGAFR